MPNFDFTVRARSITPPNRASDKRQLSNLQLELRDRSEEFRVVEKYLEAFQAKFTQTPERSRAKLKAEYPGDPDKMLERYRELEKLRPELQTKIQDLEEKLVSNSFKHTTPF
jgi:hypothetical protein